MPFDGFGTISDERLKKIDAVMDLLATPERWHKGALISHDGRRCIRGAVMAVDAVGLLEPAILQAINEVGGKRFRRIESFNDHPNTGHEQVIAVLQRTRDNIQTGRLAGHSARTYPAAPETWRESTARWFKGFWG
jgi:hypothetical protein